MGSQVLALVGAPRTSKHPRIVTHQECHRKGSENSALLRILGQMCWEQ